MQTAYTVRSGKAYQMNPGLKNDTFSIEPGKIYEQQSLSDPMMKTYYCAIYKGNNSVLFYSPDFQDIVYCNHIVCAMHLKLTENHGLIIDDDFWLGVLGVLDTVDKSYARTAEMEDLIEEFKNSKQEDSIPAHIKFQHKLGKIK